MNIKNRLKKLDNMIETIVSMDDEYGSAQYIIDNFFDSESVKINFCTKPASDSHHHTWEGGLLDHTYEVFMGVQEIIQFEKYSFIERSYKHYEMVMLLSALLHDYYKIEEYSIYDPQSDEERGERWVPHHIDKMTKVIGDMIAPSYLEGSGGTWSVMCKINQAIASHHGSKVWGTISFPELLGNLVSLKYDVDYLPLFIADYFSASGENSTHTALMDRLDAGVDDIFEGIGDELPTEIVGECLSLLFDYKHEFIFKLKGGHPYRIEDEKLDSVVNALQYDTDSECGWDREIGLLVEVIDTLSESTNWVEPKADNYFVKTLDK